MVFTDEKTSIRCIVCCIIIVTGFLMGVNEENGSGNTFLSLYPTSVVSNLRSRGLLRKYIYLIE